MKNCTPTRNVDQVDQQPIFRPEVDIFEDGDSLILVANVPGADDSQTDITLDANVLTISGTFDRPESEHATLVWSEFEASRFERTFTIPQEVDQDGIEATVTDGVLRLVLPKKEVGLKKIAVRKA